MTVGCLVRSAVSALVLVTAVAEPRQAAAQGATEGELMSLADAAAARGLPAGPLRTKIREGLAKGYDRQRIEAVVRQMSANLDAADRLMRELDPATGVGTEREESVVLLADSFFTGVTVDEVRDLRRQVQAAGRPAVSAVPLAEAAKGLSAVKAARLPVGEGAAVFAEALRQGFRQIEIIDLAREIKRREAEYRAGRASLRALREAISRGERPEQLFRNARIDAGRGATRADGVVNRPNGERPEAATQRPARPDPPARPERAERPDRPDRPQPAARPSR